jgi:hypothetical protein
MLGLSGLGARDSRLGKPGAKLSALCHTGLVDNHPWTIQPRRGGRSIASQRCAMLPASPSGAAEHPPFTSVKPPFTSVLRFKSSLFI